MSHFQGNTGTLIIVVSRARDLPNRRKMEKQSPYCLLRISNLTDKTKVDIRGGQNPRWDSEFRFNITPEVQPILKLSVLDETKKAPVLVSEGEVDFTPVFYSSVKEGFDLWHQLKAGHKDAGEIYLEMTFYPAVSGFSKSSMRKSIQSTSSKRRNLPAIPGQEVSEPELKPLNSIPPPLPRIASEVVGFDAFNQSSQSHREIDEFPRSNTYHQPFEQNFHKSDSFRPPFQPDFNQSQMSVSSLPDIPMQNHINKDLPPIRNITPPRSEPSTFPNVIADDEPTSLDPGRQRQTTDLKQFAKNLTSKYNIPIFGNKSPQQERRITDSFDELEREVQSDYIKTHKPANTRPPALPTHSQFHTLSSGSLPPPPPQHSSGSLNNSSINHYNVIEPSTSIPISPPRRKSPERKAPSNFYKSGNSSPTKLDLTSLPYDANTIPSPIGKRTEIDNYDNRVTSSKDDDILLDGYKAPTPYDIFVQRSMKESQQQQQSFGRTSPTRFKSSLPPPPPPR
ncbi:hypothetical protein BN7_3125 [Wickerhamomyces ciferrii]|uniref:C2 domain-containing protein n=1 Tax=Wickerhamomyces ciferrii (strain ATCC 14091 / BCRC 22168 / CBS 111 / JCM 3599 / NBRC 0793 / NRRL Y-1031 F-60-10) TaxID=1206466 RepID=K0KMY1_WICCF|nr:uncharacterized protein BN7_3125 [Wickerhamomyces ciferrii]CCH43572.1 hypothetical protein BN7_3125 [Wickerhamomyces ciferrii]